MFDFPGEEDIAFIDVAPNSMAKLPEKGILKKHGYGAVDGKDKWGDDSQSEQLEAGSQSDGQEPAGAVADMEYKFKVSYEYNKAYSKMYSLNPKSFNSGYEHS